MLNRVAPRLASLHSPPMVAPPAWVSVRLENPAGSALPALCGTPALWAAILVTSAQSAMVIGSDAKYFHCIPVGADPTTSTTTLSIVTLADSATAMAVYSALISPAVGLQFFLGYVAPDTTITVSTNATTGGLSYTFACATDAPNALTVPQLCPPTPALPVGTFSPPPMVPALPS